MQWPAKAKLSAVSNVIQYRLAWPAETRHQWLSQWLIIENMAKMYLWPVWRSQPGARSYEA